MYQLKDELKKTVTLEQLINVAGELVADAYDDYDDDELWLQDQQLIDSFEGIIRHLFKIEDSYIMNELSDAITEAGDKAFEQRQAKRNSK